MPETIKDLRLLQQDPIIVVAGQDMLKMGPIDKQIESLKVKRVQEEAMLESAGYDYGGDEQWAEAMRRVGRR